METSILERKTFMQLYTGKFKLPRPKIHAKKRVLLTAREREREPVQEKVKMEREDPSKVVVFDLDETLGSFGDLFLLWTGIQHIYSDFDLFREVVDIYPEFLRPGILAILQFLYLKKKTRECEKIFIYTNNQCPPTWISLLIDYFQYKTNPILQETPLFDKVIGAFKIANIAFEISRTTHKKTYSDLINCTMLPKNTEYCYIDDTEYIKMKHDKVYYIKPKAYYHSLSVQEIVEKWMDRFHVEYSKISPSYLYSWFSLHGRSGRLTAYKDILLEREIDQRVSRKMMFHIREFFLLTTYHPFWKKNTGTTTSTKKKRLSFTDKRHHKTYRYFG